MAERLNVRGGILFALAIAGAMVGVKTSAAPSGGFLVHVNENQQQSDSRRSITFYDADGIGGGPLFSVVIPLENFVASGDVSQNNYEELGAITIDPATGDVYLISFDSTSGTGMIGGVAFPGTEFEDTEGDFDLYRINFGTVYTHWESTFMGQTAAGMPGVGGTTPKGSNNAMNSDYVTYGVGPRTAAGEFNGLHTGAAAHANTFVLPGAIEKIGEINRNDASGFFDPSLEFIDAQTLTFLDTAVNDTASDPAKDRVIRNIKKLAGPATSVFDSVKGVHNGGYNRGTSESWASQILASENLDSAPFLPDTTATPTVRSESESSAFYAAPGGVRGLWITENDGDAATYSIGGGQHEIAFYQLDANGGGIGYRDLANTSSLGTTFKSFVLDDNPAGAPGAMLGKADNIFVDSDTGDVIVIESGVGDPVEEGQPPVEPSVLRLDVISYDNGGKIELGGWSQKVTLDPDKDTGASLTLPEQGVWSTYDSVNDRVYFLSPGAGAPESPQFEMDVYVLDLTTGNTTSFLNTDESVSLFANTIFEDMVGFFSLSSTPVADADFDNDGDIDGADFLTWQRGLGAGTNASGDTNGDGQLNGVDLGVWKDQYGDPPATGSAAAVPEPATLALLAMGGLALTRLRRRRRD